MVTKDDNKTAEQKAATANTAEQTSADERAATGQTGANPYPNYDFMSVEELQALADDRGVQINRDVLKAHLVTELRAADSRGF